MSKQFVRLIQHRGRRRRKRDTTELAAQLAPLEEQNLSAAEQQGAKDLGSTSSEAKRPDGSIVVDTGSLVLPKEIGEREPKGFLGIEVVVLVIVGLMLAFIAFIAWQISQMPVQ